MAFIAISMGGETEMGYADAGGQLYLGLINAIQKFSIPETRYYAMVL
jgi:hypothetical protein